MKPLAGLKTRQRPRTGLLRRLAPLALGLLIGAGDGPPVCAQAHATAPAAPAVAAPAAPPKTAAATPSPAQPAPAAASPAAGPAASIDPSAANQAFAKLETALPTATNDTQLASMAKQAAELDGAIDRALAAQQAQIAQLDASLAKIRVHRRETQAEKLKRAPLLAQRSVLVAQLGQLQALAFRADQTISAIAERRREGFSARVLEQGASPLTPDFWTSLAGSIGADIDRLDAVAWRVGDAAQSADEPKGFAGLGFGLVAAIAVVLGMRWLLRRLNARRPADASPAGRRTLAVVWRVVVGIAIPTLAAEAIRLGVQWGGLLDPAADQIVQSLIGAITWAAAVLALGRGLALAREPGHRLLSIDERQAARARAALWVVAVITAAGFFLHRLNYIVGASLAATIAANCVISLAYVGAAFLIIASFGHDDAAPGSERDAAAESVRSPAWTLLSLLLAAAIIATVAAVLLGYTTLAAMISNQIFWLGLLGAGAFLTLRLVDDLFGGLFQEHGHATAALHRLFGLRTSTVLQVGLLISAALQVLIILATVLLALTPFGDSGQLLVAHVRGLGSDVHLGKVTISPAGVAAGLATFIIGVAIAHLVQRWVVRRYMPVTHWDAGVRNSVSTGVSYVGIALALACALAVTGVGLQQIALVAGALSVGIGFGLQQIVQNFVAGIILLIERPVKVGDWVNVGGVEGDILNIRVRATDIRSLDGSMMIVPNSSLITTNVQNKTVGDPHALVQLQISVTRPGDVAKSRTLILELAQARADILKAPEPAVFVDALTAGGGANLIAWLYVADPRTASRIKSELYLALLDRLQSDEIAL